MPKLSVNVKVVNMSNLFRALYTGCVDFDIASAPPTDSDQPQVVSKPPPAAAPIRIYGKVYGPRQYQPLVSMFVQ